MTQKVTVIYDGDCPFCQRFVLWQRLREEFEVHLIDARSFQSLSHLTAGYDLDEGMLVIYDGRPYFGADAIAVLAELGSRKNLKQTLFHRVFRSVGRARLAYPFFKLARRGALKILGRSRINE